MDWSPPDEKVRPRRRLPLEVPGNYGQVARCQRPPRSVTLNERPGPAMPVNVEMRAPARTPMVVLSASGLKRDSVTEAFK